MRNLDSFACVSIETVKQEYGSGPGRHWFDRDTMRFFKTRLPELAYLSDDQRRAYFVTSEQGPHGPRAYTVRWFDRDVRDVNTHGDFNAMTKSQAMSEMRRVLNHEPQRRRFMTQARKLSDDDVRRHASVVTQNGTLRHDDNSFTACCEWVRQERGLPKLHEDEDAA